MNNKLPGIEPTEFKIKIRPQFSLPLENSLVLEVGKDFPGAEDMYYARFIYKGFALDCAYYRKPERLIEEIYKMYLNSSEAIKGIEKGELLLDPEDDNPLLKFKKSENGEINRLSRFFFTKFF